MKTYRRWRGLQMLIHDVIEHGSSAVERLHLGTVQRPFSALEWIPGASLPSRAIRFVHDTTVRSVYDRIRTVNRRVGLCVGQVMDGIAGHLPPSAMEPVSAPPPPARNSAIPPYSSVRPVLRKPPFSDR